MLKRILALSAAVVMLSAAGFAEEAVSPLPTSLTPGHVPNPAGFTESSYEDAATSVQMEHLWVDGVRFNVARIKVADASQLRTAIAAPYAQKRTNRVSAMANQNNAVIAIGGDFYASDDKGYVVRMGEVGMKQPNPNRDMLIIDDKGDFHFVLKTKTERDYAAALRVYKESGMNMVNVFNFGPALVIDGVKQAIPKSYSYNMEMPEPRTAIGQLGPLEYLFVVADGRGAADSPGCTGEQLAQFMFDQGCINAYNLDGGNSALMVFNGQNYSEKEAAAERAVSDIVYIATAVDHGLDDMPAEELEALRQESAFVVHEDEPAGESAP
ncbi:MAG: phosphodiester glycosidase family protein [Clostridia bacterium]|nr:phosphodiester glycosidase family protein [Clostridia bacterium]